MKEDSLSTQGVLSVSDTGGSVHIEAATVLLPAVMPEMVAGEEDVLPEVQVAINKPTEAILNKISILADMENIFMPMEDGKIKGKQLAATGATTRSKAKAAVGIFSGYRSS